MGNASSPVDFLRIARDRQIRDGQIATASLERLLDLLANDSGQVDYLLRGDIDARGRPVLDLEARGEISLLCQRCLAPVAFALAVGRRLVLVADENSLPSPDEEPVEEETIDSSSYVSVEDLVEQEILLSLPMAVTHDHGCETRRAEALPSNDRSPFAALAEIRRVHTGT